MSNTLTPDDAEAIREVPGVQYLVETVRNRGGQVVAGNQNWNTQHRGDERRPADDQVVAAASRARSSPPTDVTTASKVCVIGTTVKTMLFPDGNDPVGEIIRIGKHPFKIIGVLTQQGPVVGRPGPGRRHLRAVHDGAEEDAGHHVHRGDDGVHGVGGQHQADGRRHLGGACGSGTRFSRATTTTSWCARSRTSPRSAPRPRGR